MSAELHMILLEPIVELPGFYQTALMDNCIDEADTSLIENIWEGATLLSNFETAWKRALDRLVPYGYVFTDADFQVGEKYVKPLWQCVRNGLAYDWAINYTVSMLEAAYPYTKHTRFKHTEANINRFLEDDVFADAVSDIAQHVSGLNEFAFVAFENPRAFAELYRNFPGKSLEEALTEAAAYGEHYGFPTNQEGFDRMRFLVVAMEMLSQAIGSVKREHWHRIFAQIENGVGEVGDCVVLMGSKFSAYCYGRLDGHLGWHYFANGIQMLGTSGRIRTLGENKKFPDKMTFFHMSNNTVHVDETHFPKLSLDGKSWYSPQDWVSLDKKITREPMQVYVKYEHPYAANGTVKVKGTGILVKDETVQLDANGVGSTQIQARGHGPEIKIVEGTKTLPFGVFPSKIEEATLPWLT